MINTPVDIESLGVSRDIILDKYNIWEVINKKINEIL
jgi:hypothetical protein